MRDAAGEISRRSGSGGVEDRGGPRRGLRAPGRVHRARIGVPSGCRGDSLAPAEEREREVGEPRDEHDLEKTDAAAHLPRASEEEAADQAAQNEAAEHAADAGPKARPLRRLLEARRGRRTRARWAHRRSTRRGRRGIAARSTATARAPPARSRPGITAPKRRKNRQAGQGNHHDPSLHCALLMGVRLRRQYTRLTPTAPPVIQASRSPHCRQPSRRKRPSPRALCGAFLVPDDW